MSARVSGARAYLLALAAVLAMSIAIGAIISVVGVARISVLYLIVVLAVATRVGRGPAIFASIAAFVIYDWFFTEPYHTLAIKDADEWISLGLSLLTAVITSELAANERVRAETATRREREANLLYDTARVVSHPDLDEALRAVAGRVRTELRVAGVAIDIKVAGRTHAVTAGETDDALVTAVLSAGGPSSASRPGRWIRVVRAGGIGKVRWTGQERQRYEVPISLSGRTIGNIALLPDPRRSEFSTHESRLLALIATQLGALAGRAELQEATTNAEVLRRTDELKDALLSAVSHDLRTPLASIIASAGSLRQKDVRWTDRERDEFLDTVEQEAQRLARIVGNLLDLSRIEAGALRPDKQLHDIRALVDDVVVRLTGVTAGHTISIDVADDLPPVPMDETQADQVLSNLVENAVKYSPAGTEIGITARIEGGDLAVEVADRGPGIPPNELEELFAPFHRLPGARSRTAGLGVGLAVAKGLVEAHGGRIWAGNRPDGGARFVFTLPVGSASVPPREAAAR